MDKETRNKLRYIVTQCRTILERAIGEILQGQFGIHHTGLVEEAETMTHLSVDDREYREQTIVHLKHIEAAGFKPGDAVQQLIRETSFTHLNRLCAYKMMEVRDLIRTAVSKGIKSQGFMFYMADYPEDENLWKSGQQELAYRHFLLWLGGTFANEIPALFSPRDPANRLFPPQRVLDQVMELINGNELKDIWSQDETIGWIYQYFTPKELRDKSRKEHSAPQNSYELAFRNQFYTPRYVVQFLTDNTLARTWYEMCRGKTRLKDICQYLVHRPNEIFLHDGETAPVQTGTTEEKLKQAAYVAYRKVKDPREIRMLDPACGSMHFGLYAFDLLETIYDEAWDSHPDLLSDVRARVPNKAEFVKMVPAMILEHNIHGIDIDLRATQISALALWLRAQRSYQGLGLDRDDRPRITKSNVVCAEPMPGETKLLEDFVTELEPKALGEMVRQVFHKMTLAGDAGSLLKIEEEINDIVAATKKRAIEEQEKASDRRGNIELFTTAEVRRLRGDRQEKMDFSDITDDQFWDNAEQRVLDALRTYAQRAANGHAFLRQLFLEDAERGFAFVEICRKTFDVVLMNPPFGEPSNPSKDYISRTYPRTKNDVYAAFVERWGEKVCRQGMLAAITSRTGFFLTSFEKWRQDILLKRLMPMVVADLGAGVLDTAMVETAAYCLGAAVDTAIFFRVVSSEAKSETLLNAIASVRRGQTTDRVTYSVRPDSFREIPGAPFAYWATDSIRNKYTQFESFESNDRLVRQGAVTGDDARFLRAWWEIRFEENSRTRTWVPFSKTGRAIPFYCDITLVAPWDYERGTFTGYTGLLHRPSLTPANASLFFKPGLTWPLRASQFCPSVMPSGCIFSIRGYAILASPEKLLALLAFTASRPFDYFFKLALGRYEYPEFVVGVLQKLPLPRLESVHSELTSLGQQCFNAQRDCDAGNETSHAFVAPELLLASGDDLASRAQQWGASVADAQSKLSNCQQRIDEIAYRLYELDPLDQSVIQESLRIKDAQHDEEMMHDNIENEKADANVERLTNHLMSFLIGCAFGRWDVRYAISGKVFAVPANPFAPLPSHSPGMLTSDASLDGYPFNVDQDGILVDDPDHRNDIVRRGQDVLLMIWHARAEAIEQEASEILAVKELREYFRRPSNGGFWMEHLNRYSKSRRKAPIYWLVQSARKSYALWIYYHRLDRDTLNKALVNYVEPKLRFENNRLQELRNKGTEAGATGSAARDLDRKIERQDELISELNDFHDKLRRAAVLHLEPDLNDGVVLNIAPLWELVPWKEPKKYWDELMKGEYEWSSIAKQLKEKGLIGRE